MDTLNHWFINLNILVFNALNYIPFSLQPWPLLSWTMSSDSLNHGIWLLQLWTLTLWTMAFDTCRTVLIHTSTYYHVAAFAVGGRGGSAANSQEHRGMVRVFEGNKTASPPHPLLLVDVFWLWAQWKKFWYTKGALKGESLGTVVYCIVFCTVKHISMLKR